MEINGPEGERIDFRVTGSKAFGHLNNILGINASSSSHLCLYADGYKVLDNNKESDGDSIIHCPVIGEQCSIYKGAAFYHEKPSVFRTKEDWN